MAFAFQGEQARCYPLVKQHLRGKGIEVGGPTAMFGPGKELPVYPLLGSLDNYGFHALDGDFEYGERMGRSHFCDSTTLPLADSSCDFVLSSHMLEHVANPLKALMEWRRVLKPEGYLLLVLPDGRRTFDHRRPLSTLEHLISDYRRDINEDDPAHVAEALKLTDTKHWTFPQGWREWQDVYARNAEHRQIHQHVFDAALADAAVRLAGFAVLALERLFPINIVVFAQRGRPFYSQELKA
jgi:SAM-dependent methyltransferase